MSRGHCQPIEAWILAGILLSAFTCTRPFTGSSQGTYSGNPVAGEKMVLVTDKTPEARILVVDDEPTIVELLSVSLRFQGFEVATASSGAQGLDVARTFRPDAIVLDVMMPGIDRKSTRLNSSH